MIFFFFLWYGDPRDLHSFPTRRSSDPMFEAVSSEITARCSAAVRGLRRDPADRKSTRLNSSHANISYAVFCLKKKKIYAEHARRGSRRQRGVTGGAND